MNNVEQDPYQLGRLHSVDTAYDGPTDTRGSRIIARSGKRRWATPYQNALSGLENHYNAARFLATQLGFGDAIGIDDTPFNGYRFIFK